jgi:hypothetical protein
MSAGYWGVAFTCRAGALALLVLSLSLSFALMTKRGVGAGQSLKPLTLN